MSYCRFSTSDAYIIHHCGGFVRCYSCKLDPERDVFDSPTFSGMAEHVREHIAAGHNMPWVLDALLADAAECDDANAALALASTSATPDSPAQVTTTGKGAFDAEETAAIRRRRASLNAKGETT